MKNFLIFLIYTSIAVFSSSIHAQDITPPSEILEKAKHAERVLGDLTLAQKLYTDVVNSQKINQRILGEAYLGLANCLFLSGQVEQGKTLLNTIDSKFQDDEIILSQANELKTHFLSGLPELIPAPWKDGEVLQYVTKNSFDIRYFYNTQIRTLADSKQGESPHWRTEYIWVNAPVKGHGYLSLKTDPETQEVFYSERSGVGYNKHILEEKNGDIIFREKHEQHNKVKKTSPLLSVDDYHGIIRRLPYSEGYASTFKIFSSELMTYLDMDVKTLATDETIQTEFGTYKTFKAKITTRNGDKVIEDAKVWIINDDSRILIRGNFGVYTMELTDTRNTLLSENNRIEVKKQQFALNLPPRWYLYDISDFAKEKYYGLVISLSDDIVVSHLVVREIRDMDIENTPLRKHEEWMTKWAKSQYNEYDVRKESFQEVQKGIFTGLTYVADYSSNGKNISDQIAILPTYEVMGTLSFKVETEKFNRLQPQFLSIINNVEILEPEEEQPEK